MPEPDRNSDNPATVRPSQAIRFALPFLLSIPITALVCCCGLPAALIVSAPLPEKDAVVQAPKPEPKPALPEFVTADEVRYVVTDSSTRRKVGSIIGRSRAPAGATFVIVGLRAENRGSSPRFLPINEILLVDGTGRRFSEDAEASAALFFDGENVPLMEELQPNVTRSFVLAFVVPEDAVRSGLRLEISGQAAVILRL
jgi:hypothetical protein